MNAKTLALVAVCVELTGCILTPTEGQFVVDDSFSLAMLTPRKRSIVQVSCFYQPPGQGLEEIVLAETQANGRVFSSYEGVRLFSVTIPEVTIDVRCWEVDTTTTEPQSYAIIHVTQNGSDEQVYTFAADPASQGSLSRFVALGAKIGYLRAFQRSAQPVWRTTDGQPGSPPSRLITVRKE